MAEIVTPLVTVIMPVYQAEAHITPSLNSIVKQSYSNLEIYLIDDASTDQTLNLVAQVNDSRIRIIKKEKNTGYTDSLNMGMKLANGKYIARMDADDVAHPERIAKQVAYMEANLECVVCGCNVKLIPNQRIHKYPSTNNEILEELFFTNAFAHPSVMLRKSIIDRYQIQYDKTYEPTEDYELWSRLAQLGTLHNLNEILLDYRIHENQISAYKRTLQETNKHRVRIQMFKRIDDNLNDEDSFLSKQYLMDLPTDVAILNELNRRNQLISNLSDLNKRKGIYPDNLFSTVENRLKNEWIHAVTITKGIYGLHFYKEIKSIIPNAFTRLGKKQQLSFYFKSLFYSVNI
jgi:glycosyltransferase involved in cell wall biosynthesis